MRSSGRADMRIAIGRMTLPFMLILIAVIGGYCHPAAAQNKPLPPTRPSSVQECEAFRNGYKAYLDELMGEYQRCSRSHTRETIVSWQPGFACPPKSLTKTNVPASCVPVSNQWECASSEFSTLINECLTSARATITNTAK